MFCPHTHPLSNSLDPLLIRIQHISNWKKNVKKLRFQKVNVPQYKAKKISTSQLVDKFRVAFGTLISSLRSLFDMFLSSDGRNKNYYHWDESLAQKFPVHDPCGNAATNQKTGVRNPGGAIYIRWTPSIVTPKICSSSNEEKAKVLMPELKCAVLFVTSVGLVDPSLNGHFSCCSVYTLL